jgi:hypothetical protein
MSLVAKALEMALEELIGAIRLSPDPMTAVERAKRAIIADAADAATDATVDQALKKIKELGL